MATLSNWHPTWDGANDGFVPINGLENGAPDQQHALVVSLPSRATITAVKMRFARLISTGADDDIFVEIYNGSNINDLSSLAGRSDHVSILTIDGYTGNPSHGAPANYTEVTFPFTSPTATSGTDIILLVGRSDNHDDVPLVRRVDTFEGENMWTLDDENVWEQTYGTSSLEFELTYTPTIGPLGDILYTGFRFPHPKWSRRSAATNLLFLETQLEKYLHSHEGEEEPEVIPV